MVCWLKPKASLHSTLVQKVARLPDNRLPRPAQKALRGRAGRPSGLPINLSFRDPPYIDISVSFLRLVGLFPAGPLYGLAVSYYYAYFLKGVGSLIL